MGRLRQLVLLACLFVFAMSAARRLARRDRPRVAAVSVHTTAARLEYQNMALDERAMVVAPSGLRHLRVPILLGREFVGGDTPQVVVLTYGTWQKLGAAPQIIGTQVRVNGAASTVVGITAKQAGDVVPGVDLFVPAPRP